VRTVGESKIEATTSDSEADIKFASSSLEAELAMVRQELQEIEAAEAAAEATATTSSSADSSFLSGIPQTFDNGEVLDIKAGFDKAVRQFSVHAPFLMEPQAGQAELELRGATSSCEPSARDIEEDIQLASSKLESELKQVQRQLQELRRPQPLQLELDFDDTGQTDRHVESPVQAQLIAAEKRAGLLMEQLKTTATELIATRESHERAVRARTEAMRTAANSKSLKDQLEAELSSEVLAAEDVRLQDLRMELSKMRRLIASMPPPDSEQQKQPAGRKKVANRHSRTNGERRYKRKTKAEQHLPAVLPRVRTERQKKVAAKRNPQMFDAADLPDGWTAGKLDDGTPFWFYEDNPKDIVFTFPGAGGGGSNKNLDKTTEAEPTVLASKISADAVVAEATAVLLSYFRKHQPTKANREAVAEVILDYQLQRYELITRMICSVLFAFD
jgi:hypothetical protein